MSSEYSGKVAVVTGGASGLGAAMVDLFAGAGASVAILDIDRTRAEAKALELRGHGSVAIGLRVDVADPESVASAAETVGAEFGACNVLCANVGVQQFGALDRLSDRDWEWVTSVNFLGTIRTVSGFLPLLRAGEGPRHVVLTASAAFFQPAMRMGAYVATKFAVVGYGEVLRRELAGEGINVALLFPAGMITRHLESSAAARPEAMGEAWFDPSDMEVMRSSGETTGIEHLTTAEGAVRNLLDDLHAGHGYIFTHGGYRHQIVDGHRAVLEAWDRMAEGPPAPRVEIPGA